MTEIFTAQYKCLEKNIIIKQMTRVLLSNVLDTKLSELSWCFTTFITQNSLKKKHNVCSRGLRHTLNRTVMFIPRGPSEPNTPLFLVRQL